MWRLRVLAVVLFGVSACNGTTSSSDSASSTPAPAGTTAAAPETAAIPEWLIAYREAAGGAAVDTVRTLRLSGVMVDPSDRANRRIVVEAESPAKYRQTEGPLSTSGRRHRTLIGFDGTTGWWSGDTRLGGDGLSKDPAVRERAITAASRQNFINFIAGVMPAWLPGAGVTLTTLGPVQDGPERDMLTVTLAIGDEQIGRLIIDPGTHLPTRMVVPYHRHIRPQGGEYEMRYSDYREVNGVKLPYRIARRSLMSENAPDIQWTASSYQVNLTLDAKTFEPLVSR